jgi:type IV pilus assembly protein PilE
MLHPIPRRTTLRRRALARSTGFTLVEVLVAMVVIGILAPVGIPMYSDYVMRGRLVAATNELAALRSRMEQFFQDNRTYTGGPCGTAYNVNEDFTIGCTASGALTATTYTMPAAGRTGRPTAGFSYTIDQAGVMTTAFGSAWGSTTFSSCWKMTRGTTC